MYIAGMFQPSKKGGETCLYEATTFMVQNSLCIYVHMIWLMSVLSLMPKGEIVGIKLFFH